MTTTLHHRTSVHNAASTIPLAFCVIVLASAGALAQPTAGSAQNGAHLFNACAACHSLVPNRNMTGPSLAGVFGRKAGTLANFDRYSPAIKASGITWNAGTLNFWLVNPAKVIPGTFMTFDGVSDPKARADLIAYLKVASAGQTAASSDMNSMGGMMGGGMKDLKKVSLSQQVRSIRLCRDSYFVTKADGKIATFWEPNLRFETDSSNLGPPNGRPAIMPAGMMGDRASVIFAAPEEIGAYIKHQC